jgi:hypothetical protein
VRFWYVCEDGGVQAWDSGVLPQPTTLDQGRYRELLLRAVSTLLQPFGISEKRLRQEIAAACPARPLSLWKLPDAGLAARPDSAVRPPAPPPH